MPELLPKAPREFVDVEGVPRLAEAIRVSRLPQAKAPTDCLRRPGGRQRSSSAQQAHPSVRIHPGTLCSNAGRRLERGWVRRVHPIAISAQVRRALALAPGFVGIADEGGMVFLDPGDARFDQTHGRWFPAIPEADPGRQPPTGRTISRRCSTRSESA